MKPKIYDLSQSVYSQASSRSTNFEPSWHSSNNNLPALPFVSTSLDVASFCTLEIVVA